MPMQSVLTERKLRWAALYAAALIVFAATTASAQGILSRKEWGAAKALEGGKKQVPVSIMIHHTGTKSRPNSLTATKMHNLQHFSQTRQKLADGRTKPVWSDVPYHFYIAANGEIAEGRAIDITGDTNTSYDASGYIQIVVEGNFDIEQPQPQQLASLRLLVRALSAKYGIDASRIRSHKDVASTVCPGRNLLKVLPETLGVAQ